MLFNARWIGTYRQAPGVQGFTEAEKDLESPYECSMVYPAYPTPDFKAFLRSPRFRFLRNRIISLVTIYAIDQVYESLFNDVLPQYVDPVNVYDMLPSKQTYFRRLATVGLGTPTLYTPLYTTFLPSSSSASV
jgi:hypothetical protein